MLYVSQVNLYLHKKTNFLKILNGKLTQIVVAEFTFMFITENESMVAVLSMYLAS